MKILLEEADPRNSVAFLPEVIEGDVVDPHAVFGHHAYIPYEFILFNLPYRKPDGIVWERTNSNARMNITAGEFENPDGTRHRFVPYGKYARAALLWVCTQAKLTGKPTVELGRSYNEFMRNLGIGYRDATKARGGQSSRDVDNCLNQLRALFAATVAITVNEEYEKGRIHIQDMGYRVASSSALWFTKRDSTNIDSMLPSTVTLSDELYGSVLEHGTPVDMGAWRSIQTASKSPMALDVYVWLCHRLHGLPAPTNPTWAQLYEQFGSGSDMKEFKRNFRRAIGVAKKHYPEANVHERLNTKGHSIGLRLLPSKPALSK
ncbi:replication protein RepA [Vibrio vulnificus]|uniref:replication protein RepA n=1 Tax=Vibrio vulnificus TaxID=672 RepID=UPI001032369D|nr:replication protein RepA [Vibrio vulnificus]